LSVKIGVLALQGAFREHARVLRSLGADVVEVRRPEELDGLDGLVIPGGESTTIVRLAALYGLDEAIRTYGGPIFGTCAGMIVLDREHLGLADLVVDRNAYGRQVRSFEAEVALAGDERPLEGVFIRAPRIRGLGPDVEVLGELDGEPVLVRDGRLLLAAFHPELTQDTRVHERFLELVREAPHAPDAPLASVPRGNSAQARAPEESDVQRRERGGAGLRPAGAAWSGA
jgi:pyridoxal 5'-phosphate synthase pdxT subunit